MNANLKIAPSILAADFARLGEQIAEAEAAGADLIHVDVMDGHFVPNITIGPVVIEAVRRSTSLPLDVHLMLSEPDRYLEAFAKSGADALTIHIEVCQNIRQSLQRIRDMGLRAGITLNPDTPITDISEVITDIDQVLVMSVNAGFGGQTFIEQSITRIEQARSMLDRENPQANLAVDGGINLTTASRVTQAGANILIAGHAIFQGENSIGAEILALRKAAQST
ncbi:MAG: ribulose-phosphate 3-epimerase [Anaerolineae bacterium]|nr:ribulose-phosphate 3-epimerase [Anaerolineae bacterium]